MGFALIWHWFFSNRLGRILPGFGLIVWTVVNWGKLEVMKVHTTNYFNGFIEIAEDSPAKVGEVPPVKGTPSVANLQFDMVYDHPYEYTSDDVLFAVFAQRNNISKADWPQARAEFFSKGQPCFRASPLTKRYGWGVHSDAEGRIALYAAGSEEYAQFSQDGGLEVVKAMRSVRK